MKVWVAEITYNYESGYVVGVYRTKRAAEKARVDHPGGDGYDVTEFEVLGKLTKRRKKQPSDGKEAVKEMLDDA